MITITPRAPPIYIYVCISTLLHEQDATQSQFFMRSLTGLNSEFSFSLTVCLTKVKEPSLPYYLRIAGGRIIGFIPFPKVLALCEMQTVSSRIWTQVAVSISNDGIHYTTNAFHTHTYTHIIIIISCRSHGYPWPSFITSPNRSTPRAGLQGHIPYPHIAAGCMFGMIVLLLLGHMWGSIGVHHLWARPCFSNSDLHVWFVWLR